MITPAGPRNPPSVPYELKLAMADALNRALLAVGSSTETAKILGISPQAISQWERCPADKALPLERACEREVTRYELRPDIFGDGTDV